MDNYIIAIDVGGSSIKAGIVNESLDIHEDQVCEFPSHSNKSSDTIIDNFASIIIKLYEKIIDIGGCCIGIGYGFPGPFNYREGICLMEGIGKYDAILNVHLISEINKRMVKVPQITQLKSTFINDASAFALGEFYKGSGNHEKSAYITLGTGCGSSFINDDGSFILDIDDHEPYMIFNKSFKDSIVDSYVSIRAILLRAEFYGLKEKSVEAIGAKAIAGDERCKKVFEDYGADLGKVISQYVIPFNPKVMVFGGGISKAYPLFKDSMCQQIKQKNIQIKISEKLSKSSIIGAAAWLLKNN